MSDSALYRRAVTGLLDELNDPNSVYLSGERLARLDERTSGLYVGLGVRVAGTQLDPAVVDAFGEAYPGVAGLVPALRS